MEICYRRDRFSHPFLHILFVDMNGTLHLTLRTYTGKQRGDRMPPSIKCVFPAILNRYSAVAMQLQASILCILHVFIRLNETHHLWYSSNEWELWVGTSTVGPMFCSFAAVVMLHMLRNKWIRIEAFGGDERVEVCFQKERVV